MIQRKQTLFLFVQVFLGISLLFFPVNTVTLSSGTIDVFLIQLKDSGVSSTSGHVFAVILNFLCLILASSVIFLYRNRELQLKLSYLLLVLWLILCGMLAFCPFVVQTEANEIVNSTYFGPGAGILGIIACVLATRFIKKDIALIKSADRIR